MNRPLALSALLATAFLAGALPAWPQALSFKSLQQDSSLPVQVNSDSLSVDQASGVAVFEGNVVIVQGEMTVKAAKARVQNAPEGGIDKIFLTGGVTFASPTEAAEAEEAVYTVPMGEVVMTGKVLLTQGQTTIAGDKLVYDLNKGTGQMQGRVQTTFVPGTSKSGGTP